MSYRVDPKEFLIVEYGSAPPTGSVAYAFHASGSVNSYLVGHHGVRAIDNDERNIPAFVSVKNSNEHEVSAVVPPRSKWYVAIFNNESSPVTVEFEDE